jgi:hypothetical protein
MAYYPPGSEKGDLNPRVNANKRRREMGQWPNYLPGESEKPPGEHVPHAVFCLEHWNMEGKMSENFSGMLTARVPDDLAQKVRRAARQQMLSVSDIVRLAVARELNWQPNDETDREPAAGGGDER